MSSTTTSRALQFRLPGFPEQLTIVEHDPDRTLVEVDLAPGGRVPLHVHQDYEERFEVLDGQLDIRLADRTIALETGDCHTAPAKLAHCFENNSGESTRFRVELVPGQRGFVEMQLLFFGLRSDERVRSDGAPRDPRQLAVGFGWSQTAPAAAGPALMMRVLRATARLTGEERRLRERYVTPAEERIAAMEHRAALPPRRRAGDR
jgi:mannose-6-phosphate isomerase-like protein (cupin superfamily)